MYRTNDFAEKIANLRASLLATLAKASETNSDTQINDVLRGQGFHTFTTESFFPKLTYSAEAFDSEGKLLVDKFPSCTSTVLEKGTTCWKCSPTLCSIPTKMKSIYK